VQDRVNCGFRFHIQVERRAQSRVDSHKERGRERPDRQAEFLPIERRHLVTENDALPLKATGTRG